MAAHALIVEDDEVLGPLMERHLNEHGLSAILAPTGGAAANALRNDPFDIVVLDLGLPDTDGFQVCECIRAKHDVPVIIMTGNDDRDCRIRGYQVGAEDYLIKPFTLPELESRISTVLRRARKQSNPEQTSVIRLGPLVIDMAARTAVVANCAVELTPSEFDLLARMASNPGQPFARDELLDCIQGGQTDAFDRAVDTHISNLRKKIERDPKSPEIIKTVWGSGYKIERFRA